MNFRIGKIADLLGMSTEGLRLYERSGIVKPKRGEDNTAYRTYGHLDFTALIRARGYHYTGFSTKEIADLLNAKSVDDILAGYEAQEEKIAQELRYKELLLQNLRELRKKSADAEKNLWKIERRVRPAMYRFPFIRDGNFLIDAEKEAVFHEWLLKTPFVFISQSNEWGKLLSGSTQITAALGIFEEQLSFFDLDMKFARYYPSCSCLYSIVQEQGESFQPLDCLSSLMDFVKGNGIKVTDDPVSNAFLSMNKYENYTRFREVWLPIQE